MSEREYTFCYDCGQETDEYELSEFNGLCYECDARESHRDEVSCRRCHRRYVDWNTMPSPPMEEFGEDLCPSCFIDARENRPTLADLEYVRQSLLGG